MPRDYIRVKDGYRLIMDLFSPYRRRIYAYNESIKEFGYYLKPIHIVVKKATNLKYIYFGRYWYRLVKMDDGRVKWIYIGREKPDPHLPDPPLNPFEGLRIMVVDDDVIVDEYVYRILNTFPKNR